MFRYPSDELVELSLGPKVKTWAPQPAHEIARSVAIPDRNAVSLLILPALLLGAGGFVLVLVTTRMFMAAVLSGVAVVGVCMWAISVLSNAVHKTRRLGVFELGIRFCGDLIRFDELRVISFGSPKSTTERFMPTFRNAQRKIERFPETRLRLERTRDLALTPILFDETHKVWLGFAAMYRKEEIEEFFATIESKCANKVCPMGLTFEERREIEGK